MPLVLPKLHKGRFMSQKYTYVVLIPHLKERRSSLTTIFFISYGAKYDRVAASYCQVFMRNLFKYMIISVKKAT